MIFIHCAGNGDIHTTDAESGVMVEFATFEAACLSVEGRVDVAWFSHRDAADFYFYDFIWGEATSAVTVPVGAWGEKITYYRPERQLVRA
jgi:hypothetical protein